MKAIQPCKLQSWNKCPTSHTFKTPPHRTYLLQARWTWGYLKPHLATAHIQQQNTVQGIALLSAKPQFEEAIVVMKAKQKYTCLFQAFVLW